MCVWGGGLKPDWWVYYEWLEGFCQCGRHKEENTGSREMTGLGLDIPGFSSTIGLWCTVSYWRKGYLCEFLKRNCCIGLDVLTGSSSHSLELSGVNLELCPMPYLFLFIFNGEDRLVKIITSSECQLWTWAVMRVPLILCLQILMPLWSLEQQRNKEQWGF